MGIHFRTLLQIEVTHGYYGGLCPDLAFVVPSDEPALAAGRLLVREREGRLLVLFETDEAGNALSEIAGTTLFVGLRQLNPAFANFTQPPLPDGSLPLYANDASPTVFSAPVAAHWIAAQQRIEPVQGARPLSLRWQRNGLTLAEQTLVAGENEAMFATRDWPAGRYTLSETAGGPEQRSTWLLSRSLADQALWCVVAVTIAPTYYATPPTLRVALLARSDVLQYYVVARNFGTNEFNQLQLTDAGAAEQARPAIAFAKVLPAEFAADDLLPASLGDASARIVLFQSLAPVARRAGGYRKLQLKRNNEVLVQHLPQAGSDRAQARFVVHLAKS
ncbi:MAG: hypothetical protein HZT41_04035 [Dechloromonas sp.]|nr:MAG: hypothetical protein HZT41_04035 [Dechloromonas sp.]